MLDTRASLIVSRTVCRIAEQKPSYTAAVLDCCREFRYKASFDRSLEPEAGPIKRVNASNGVILGFACAPNKKASDNPGGANGV